MIDEKLYREAFSRLRASDEAKEEVLLKMSEMNAKKRRSLKTLRVLAMAAMLTLALAVTANAASNGELMNGIIRTFSATITMDSGDGSITVTPLPEGVTEGMAIPKYGIVHTEERDGRLFLVRGDEEIDITDELSENGEYTLTLEDGVTVTVSGTVEDHMLLSSETDGVYFVTNKTKPLTNENGDADDGRLKS